jgi:hypothetical protein
MEKVHVENAKETQETLAVVAIVTPYTDAFPLQIGGKAPLTQACDIHVTIPCRIARPFRRMQSHDNICRVCRGRMQKLRYPTIVDMLKAK